MSSYWAACFKFGLVVGRISRNMWHNSYHGLFDVFL